MYTFHDIAIPISWPDKTAYGDEKWMAFLKRIGIVKNLHFKVGHAAILLIERNSNTIRYFDFGRYLSPRGYGRARSSIFDPRLNIQCKAQFNANGELQNLSEIFAELSEKETATHGGGRTVFSVCKNISYAKSVRYADKLVAEGPILYGAFAKENNSCSRYVAQILCEGMDSDDQRRRKILYPECLKASPTSNVVNAAQHEEVFCYENGQLSTWKMNRRASLSFQFGLIKDNFTKKGAQQLASDQTIGMIQAPERPSSVPATAQWMEGIGEGAWFHLEKDNMPQLYRVTKYTATGQLEYRVATNCMQAFSLTRPYRFTPNFLYNSYSIIQDNNLYVFSTVKQEGKNNFQETNKQAIS